MCIYIYIHIITYDSHSSYHMTTCDKRTCAHRRHAPTLFSDIGEHTS